MPFFRAATSFVMNESTPLDSLDQSSSLEVIGKAIQQTVRLVISDAFLNQMRAYPGSARYFGALAVDAWSENDMTYVKKFLIKALFADYLILQGPEALLIEAFRAERPSLPLRLQQVLRDQEIKTQLRLLTRGSCSCIDFSVALNEANGNEAAKAARKQREIEQLPPVLKPESKFWKLKKKAASRLQANRLEESIVLYKQAQDLIFKELQGISDAEYRPESIKELSNENGRVASNLSMIYSKMLQYDMALLHANKAVAHFPSWSKSHCRRAVALEGLGRLEDADASVCKALELWDAEFLVSDDGHILRKAKDEYKQIEHRIEEALESQQLVDLGTSIRKLHIPADYAEAGLLSSLLETGVLDRVATFLSPKDVARLEQTCRGLAAQPERRRRISLSSPLLNFCSEKVDKRIGIYCSEKLDDPNGSLRTLVASILPIVDSRSYERTLPSWLRTMLDHADVAARNTIQSECVRQKSLLKPLCYWIRQSIFFGQHPLTEQPDEEELLRMYRNDCDSQLLRVIAWSSQLIESGEDSEGLLELTRLPNAGFNNLISKSVVLRAAVSRTGSPIEVVNQALNSVVSENFPHKWPCEETLELGWNYSADNIYMYFSKRNPRDFRRWKNAFQKLLKWAQDAEPYNVQITLFAQGIMTACIQQTGRVELKYFLTIGLFGMKKSMESGGAESLMRKVVTQRDVSELIADYYSMIRLYNVSLPKALAWRDAFSARQNMMSSGLRQMR